MRSSFAITALGRIGSILYQIDLRLGGRCRNLVTSPIELLEYVICIQLHLNGIFFMMIDKYTDKTVVTRKLVPCARLQNISLFV